MNDTNQIFIFLDFDGVLHKNNGKAFTNREVFADTIKDFENVKIIFSTSWREYSTLDRLKQYLPQNIRDMCVGMTPVIKDDIRHVRYQEILLYNSTHNIHDNWIAVDDMSVLFPEKCANLLLINEKEAFTVASGRLLKKKIKLMIK
jgi:hypothetical protein